MLKEIEAYDCLKRQMVDVIDEQIETRRRFVKGTATAEDMHNLGDYLLADFDDDSLIKVKDFINSFGLYPVSAEAD